MLVVFTIMINHFVLGLTWAQVVQCALQPRESLADTCAENCAESCAENCAENCDLDFDFDSDQPSRTCFRKVAPKKKKRALSGWIFSGRFSGKFSGKFWGKFSGQCPGEAFGQVFGRSFRPLNGTKIEAKLEAKNITEVLVQATLEKWFWINQSTNSFVLVHQLFGTKKSKPSKLHWLIVLILDSRRTASQKIFPEIWSAL